MKMTQPQAKPPFAVYLFAYVRLMHPWPVLMVMLAATMLALLAAGGRLDALRLLHVLLTVFLSQYAIGALNEYCDRDLDAQAARPKPIAEGLVRPSVALALAWGSFALMALLAAPFGPLLWLLCLLAGASGMLYDLGLKRTWFSWLPYFVSFPLLPIWVASAMRGEFAPRLLWLLPVLGSLVVGLHLSNSLPDVELDKAQGSRSLAVALGLRGGILACWLSYALAQMVSLVLLLTPLFATQRRALALAVVASVLALLASVAVYQRDPSPRGRQLLFRLLGFSAMPLVGGWLVALT